ncbi:hypothetical protein AB0K48_07495 [Nonomuraea sp. NPDC055795]
MADLTTRGSTADRLGARLHGYHSEANAVNCGEPRAILRCAIKVGKRNSLAELVALLDRHGTPEIATDHLNCGSRELADAGGRWARKLHWEIQGRFGGPPGGVVSLTLSGIFESGAYDGGYPTNSLA